MNSNILFPVCLAAAFLLAPGLAPRARADAKSKAVQEAVEYAAKKFGWNVGKEGLETVAKRLETQAVRHGDDLIRSFRHVGDKAFEVAEKHGAQGLKMVARHGDGAVVHVLAKPKALALVKKLGEEATEALVKHPGVAEDVVENFGAPAAKALCAVGPRNGRRLAMMAKGGELAELGRTDEVLGVVGKFGDSAMNFVWEHKGALAVGAVLAVFLAEPESFLNGAKDITQVAAETVAKPLAEAAGQAVVASVAPEVGKNTNWTLVLSAAVFAPVVLAGYWTWRYLPRPRSSQQALIVVPVQQGGALPKP